MAQQTKQFLAAWIAEYPDSSTPVTQYTPHLLKLLNSLERVLYHGLKGLLFRLSICLSLVSLPLFLSDKGFFGKTTPFEFIEHLGECLPGCERFLERVRSGAKTNIGSQSLFNYFTFLGRTRVFLRESLNEGTLEENLSSLAWNATLTK